MTYRTFVAAYSKVVRREKYKNDGISVIWEKEVEARLKEYFSADRYRFARDVADNFGINNYEIFYKKICNDEIPCESANIKLEEYYTIECEKFSTQLFEDAIRVSVSKENIDKYVKMDRLYIGLSSTKEIVEICVMPLSKEEVRHIKTELEYQ